MHYGRLSRRCEEGGPWLIMGDYVTETGPTTGATVAGGC